MAVIKSGVSSDQWTIDPSSKAGRSTLYRSDGTEVFHRPTFSCTMDSLAIPATPTDLAILQGSASKVVRLVEIRVSGNQTTAGINKFYLLKRSSPDTGGTLFQPAIVSHDTEQPTAIAGWYQASPTFGTLVGYFRTKRLLCPALTSLANDEIIWNFDGINEKLPTLRGTSQLIAVSFNGAAVPAGLSLTASIEWTEE